jgi:hypothetical protein
MEYKSFDTLNSTFNIDNDIEDIEQQEEKTETKKVTKSQKYTLEDLEYMKTELQDRIESNRIVCEELKNCCKVGAPPRMFEVYAKLSMTISEDIMHLADLNRQITDYQIVENKENMRKQEIELKQQNTLKKIEAASIKSPQSVTQNNYNTYNITSKDLLNKVIDEMGEEGEVITTLDELPKFNLE